MTRALRVLVVGLGNMGLSHAKAYDAIDGFELAGLCARGIAARADLPSQWAAIPRFTSYQDALSLCRPDVVSINTWPDTHARFALKAIAAGAHVFVEKPLAETVAAAQEVAEAVRRTGRKLVVGYILRHHPAWQRFIACARDLGRPLVMRMNLNQQSAGAAWDVHRRLLGSLSPIVDCGVHYLDVMCQIVGSRPTRVHGVMARLADFAGAQQPNYGHLHVAFADGSVGWYEAGWGPMMSETAFFVKDVIGPRGSVSLIARVEAAHRAQAPTVSSDIDFHTRTDCLLIHHAELNAEGDFLHADELIDIDDDPGHQGLCRREQEFLLCAIREDVDLSGHINDAISSLSIALAADRSAREGSAIDL
jgi:predicted dehydrogenase